MASSAGMAVASRLPSFWSRAANFISSNMSTLLFSLMPSLPSPTCTPAFSAAGTGQMPEASFILLTGQWAMEVPVERMISIS